MSSVKGLLFALVFSLVILALSFLTGQWNKPYDPQTDPCLNAGICGKG